MTYLRPRTALLTGMIVLATCGLAQAGGTQDVVRDVRGHVIHNTFGNCVRTRWMTDQAVCPGRAEITLAERTVYFEFNKSTLTAQGKHQLDMLAVKLKEMGSDVQAANIVGYADRIGDASYNDKLSQKRAEAVRDYLVHKGVVKAHVTETRWVGKNEPSANCAADLPRKKLISCLQEDRRVEVEIEYN